MNSGAAALLLLATLGCTTTTRARRGSPEAQDWLTHHDSSEVEAELVTDRPTARAAITIDARGAGVLFGLVYGATRPLSTYEQSGDCSIVCNHGDAAKLGALMFGALGLVVGAATGAVVGTRDELDLR